MIRCRAMPSPHKFFFVLLVVTAFVMVSMQNTMRTDVEFLRSFQPAVVGKPLAAIAFGSCNKHDRNQTYWRTIHRTLREIGGEDPVSGFIWLGDVVYADTPYLGGFMWLPSTIPMMQQKFKIQKANDHYSFFEQHRRHNIIGVWDDHDMGLNDGGKEYADRDASQQIFLDFFDVPETSPLRQQKGLFSFQKIPFPMSHEQGDRTMDALRQSYTCAFCIVLLDVRSHRTAIKYEKEGDVLGEEQWRWLERTLRDNVSDWSEQPGGPAQKKCLVTLIGSGVQILSDEKPAETWGDFRDERTRLFNLIRRTKSDRVIFISGDVHLAEIMKESDNAASTECPHGAMGYPILDVTSSGLTHSLEEIVPEALYDWALPSLRRVGRFLGRNFGTIAIVLSADGRLYADISIHAIVAGQRALRFFQPLDELEHRRTDSPASGEDCPLFPTPQPSTTKYFNWVKWHLFPFLSTHQIIMIVVSVVVASSVAALITALLRWFRRNTTKVALRRRRPNAVGSKKRE